MLFFPFFDPLPAVFPPFPPIPLATRLEPLFEPSGGCKSWIFMIFLSKMLLKKLLRLQ